MTPELKLTSPSEQPPFGHASRRTYNLRYRLRRIHRNDTINDFVAYAPK